MTEIKFMPSDIFSNELYDLYWGDFYILFLCNKNGMVDVVLYIVAVLKHPEARLIFLKAVITHSNKKSKKLITPDGVLKAVRKIKKWYKNKKTRKIHKPQCNIKIHGPDYVTKTFDGVADIEHFAEGNVGLSRLMALDKNEKHSSDLVAGICKDIVTSMVELNQSFKQRVKLLDGEKKGLMLCQRYSAPWSVCSCVGSLGLWIEVSQATRWHELSLDIDLEFGGLGILTADNQSGRTHYLLSAMRTSSVYEMLNMKGLPNLNPRQVSWILCITADHIEDALKHIDAHCYTDVSVPFTFGGKYDDECMPCWAGSVPGCFSDQPPWRIES